MEDSESEWCDSDGNLAEILDTNDQAFAATENVILKSFQKYLNVKHGDPSASPLT